jgi:hypothetical protein
LSNGQGCTVASHLYSGYDGPFKTSEKLSSDFGSSETMAFFAGSHYGGFELKLSSNCFMTKTFCDTERSLKQKKETESKDKTKYFTRIYF